MGNEPRELFKGHFAWARENDALGFDTHVQLSPQGEVKLRVKKRIVERNEAKYGEHTGTDERGTFKILPLDMV